MSDLQLGLLAIGAVVVIVVIAYNKWQEVRYRREADRNMGSRHNDALMGSADDVNAASVLSSAAPQYFERARVDERIEPTFDGRRANVAHAVSPVADETLLSDSIDFVVPMEASEEIDGDVLIDAAAALQNASKPVRLEGFNEAAAKWEALRRGARYSLLRAGIQLVNRQGPVNEDELVSFGTAVQQAAAAAGALATVPSCSDGAERASLLDEFCGQVDILIALHVVPTGTPFAGTKVRALAEASGLRLEDDGRFRRRDDGGRVLYEIASMDSSPFRSETLRTTSVSGITLELDVPRTPDPARIFEQFRDLAGRTAQALEARIVDEKRSPVSAAAFEQISAQIQTMERAMNAHSIAPGSPPALRLFS